MPRYVGLLRGINVGGANLIRMADLRGWLEDGGLTDVGTYIQSGNVLFSSRDTANARIAAAVEALIGRGSGLTVRVVVRSHEQLRDIVALAPAGFGASPARYRYDVIFLKEPLTAPAAMRSIRLKEGVDEAHTGRGVLYFARLVAKAPQSQLSRLASIPEYQRMTIRNWNTTTRLLAMLDASG